MKRTLVLAIAAVLVAVVAGCGGGGGGSPTATPSPTPSPTPTPTPTPSPTPTPEYGAFSHAVESDCEFLVGVIKIGSASQSSVSSEAGSACQARANRSAQEAGVTAPRCSQPTTFDDCAAYAVGVNNTGGCHITFAAGSSRTAVRQAALNECERRAGTGANCAALNGACTTDSESPPVGVWTRSPDAAGDHPDTRADAALIKVGDTVSARIDSPTDVDYFRLPISHTGTLTVWTTGEVATDLTLLDSAGNELRSGSQPLGLGTRSVSANAVRTTSEGRNISSQEIAVRAGTAIFAKVTGRGDLGSYTFESRNIRVGVSNVVRGPQLSISAGSAPLTVDLTAQIDTSQARGELSYSATFDTPVRVGGVPLGVSITLSGSILTIVTQERGPTYSGTVGIRVEVRDPFGLFAVKVLNLEFTREAEQQSELQDCVSVRVTRNTNYCAAILKPGGYNYFARFTNSCDKRLEFRYEWSTRYDNGPPSSAAGAIRAGGTSSATSIDCLRVGIPTIRYCVYESGNSSRCYGDNPAYGPPVGHQ